MARALPTSLSVCLSLVAGWPAPGRAYEVKTSSAGAPLRWTEGEIRIELALGLHPEELLPGDSEAAAKAAIASWQAALEGLGVSLIVGEEGHPPAVIGDGIASLRWAVDEDDPDIETGLLATTHLTYRVSDGAIEDADVVINAAEFVWTVSPGNCADEYDLESSLAHELGHLLGLGHPGADHPEATMFATSSQCETLKRDLAGDDQAGIDYLYGEVPPPRSSVVEPAACGAGGTSGGWATAIALAALAWLARSKRAGPRRLAR
jgi:Matrixin